MVEDCRGDSPEVEASNLAAERTIDAAMQGGVDLAVDMGVREAEIHGPAEFSDSLVFAARRRWPDAAEADIEAWAGVCDPDDPSDVLFNFAIALWSVDELDKGLQAMTLAVQRNDESARMMLAESELFMEHFASAERNLLHIISRGGEDTERAMGLLGSFYFHQLGRLDDEVFALRRGAGRSDPSFPVDLAKALVATGDFHSAVSLLRSESAQGNPYAPLPLGNILDEQYSDAAGAETAYRRGIELGDAYSAYNLAAMMSGQGRLDESHDMLVYAADHGDEKAIARLAAESQ